MSDAHECPVCTQSSLLAVQQRPPGCEVSHDLVVILSTDLAIYFLGQFKHQWIHKISVTTQHVFFPPPLTNHPYVFTCGTGEKLSKMVGNSASKPSKRAPAELPCITIDWWRSLHHAFSRYTVINILKLVFSVFINARIRPLLLIFYGPQW